MSSDRSWFAAWQDNTAEMLKMMDAFSKAREYWEVGLCVNASNLVEMSAIANEGRQRERRTR